MKRSLFFLFTMATLLALAACVAPTQPMPATPTAEVPPAPEASTTEPASSGDSDEAETALDDQESVYGEDASSTDEAASEENEGTQTSMAASPLSTEPGSFEIAQLAQINPPPQLSRRALGVSVVPCADAGIRGPAGVEGETYTCGIFTVPQNWNDPDGRNLDLTFVVAKATGEDPRPDPLIFLAGGPGQSAVVTPVSIYDKLRPAHDIVRLDQRGTGYSQRLGWEECLVLAAQDSDPGPGLDALQAIVFPSEALVIGGVSESPLSDAQTVAQVNQLCWDQFTGQGLDLNEFDTTASARDVIELIKALGYDSFNVHGVSYGTRLAMTIMDDLSSAADGLTLRSVVLDSTFPPSIYMLSSLPRNDHDLVLQLLDDCRQDDLCREAYPNLDGRLGLLLDRLAREPLAVDGETVTTHDLARELGNLGSRRAGFMPKMVSELETGVLDTYLGLRNGELGSGFPEGVPGLDRSDPVQAFVGDAVALIGGNDDLGVMFDFIASVGDALATDDPQGALQGLIDENYTGDTGDQLLTWLAALTPEDFSSSPYVAQAQGLMKPDEDAPEPDPEAQAEAERIQQRTLAALGFAQPLFNTIHCSEDIRFERIEDAVNSFNDLKYPQFSSLELSQDQIDACQNWPVETAPIEVKDPVSSSVPALILQGAYDTRTPVYMGKRTARELKNSTFVLVPQQGHEVWTSAGSCAANIAAAFVMDPDQEVDQSCLDLRRPQWALPEAATPLASPGETSTTEPAGESSMAADEDESTAEQVASLPEVVVAQLDTFLQSQVYSEGADPVSTAPGLVLLVDTPDGRYLQAAGVASLEDGTPMQVDDRLEIGSNSKSFTIVLLMQLQEEGVLSLDDSLSDWLPEWVEKIPNGSEMTLRQHAQHTAGIWDYGDPILGEAANDPDKLELGYSPEELVQYAIDNGAPDFAPGEEGMWKYSNTGYVLLGMILEKATGQSLGELYEERIFDPLGLETAALIEGVPGAGEITRGYWWTEEGEINDTTNWNVSQGWAAGGIAMTAEELLTYGKALAAGELFQDPDTLAEMLIFDPNGMEGLMPYGLGLLDFSQVGAPGSWGHEGQTAGFQSLWFTNPKTGITVVGLTNSATYSAWAFLGVAPMLEQEISP